MRYANWLLVTIIGILFLLMGSSLQARQKSIFEDKALKNKAMKAVERLEDEALEKKFLRAMEIINDKAAVKELLKLWEKKVIDPWDIDVDVLLKVPDETVSKAFENFSDEELARLTKGIMILFKGTSVAPEGTSYLNYLHDTVIPRLERATKGLLSIKFYTGGVLGDEADTIRKMRMRQLHVIAATAMGTTMICPNFCVVELPFLFDWEPELYYGGKYCQADYIFKKLRPSMRKLFEERGFELLADFGISFMHLTSQIPIKSVEDFKKLKFFMWRGDRIRPHINKVFDFKKIVSSELYNVVHKLSTGMTDTAVAAWYESIVLQWWPHVKYATDYPVYGYERGGAFMEKRAIDRMIALCYKVGPVLGLMSGRELEEKMRKIMEEEVVNLSFIFSRVEAEAREELIRRGAIEEVHFPEEELEKLRQKVLPLYDELADKLYPRWFLDEILKYRQEYRKLKAAGKLDEFHETGIIK